ncbi:MAG: hypothetical protein ACOX45_01295 [Acutalibacteraceae bacterium]
MINSESEEKKNHPVSNLRTGCFFIVLFRCESARLSKNYALGGIEEQRRLLEENGIEVVDCKVDLDKFGV